LLNEFRSGVLALAGPFWSRQERISYRAVLAGSIPLPVADHMAQLYSCIFFLRCELRAAA